MSQTEINRYNFPDIAEFLSRRMRDISARINCHTIGTIVSFNSTNQTAVIDVNFLTVLKGVNPIGDTGLTSDEILSIPSHLVDVPVVFLQGGGSAITFPIVAGDTCLLLFCDRDMDTWLQTGQTNVPNSNRVHDINDAVAIVGLRGLNNPLPSYDNTNLKISFGGASIVITPAGNITITGGTVTIIGSTQVAINP